MYALTGRTGAHARLWVMVAQIGVDLLSCLVTARLAALLALRLRRLRAGQARVFRRALARCFVSLHRELRGGSPDRGFRRSVDGARLQFPCACTSASRKAGFSAEEFTPATSEERKLHFLCGGMRCWQWERCFVLKRPFSWSLRPSCWECFFFPSGSMRRWFSNSLAMVLGCLVVLSPWALRNRVTLGEPQFLAPKKLKSAGELVPYGFMAWEKTWLFRVRDCYLVPWKLNEESISVDDIPARAFDTPEEKQRVAAILEQYNNDLTLTPEEECGVLETRAGARLAPSLADVTSGCPLLAPRPSGSPPRIELLPVSGDVFPLAQKREDDPVDQKSRACFLF